MTFFSFLHFQLPEGDIASLDAKRKPSENEPKLVGGEITSVSSAIVDSDESIFPLKPTDIGTTEKVQLVCDTI